jgi:RNA polymerase sigma-70 factor (ECF subfamily)
MFLSSGRTEAVAGLAGLAGDTWNLVDAARSGCRESFGLLYAQYWDAIFGYLRARTGNSAIAEDLASDTFVRALQSIGTLSRRADTSPRAWFITIARNLLLDDLKSSRRRREIPVWDLFDTDAGHGSATSNDGLSAVLRAESRRAVHTAMQRLGDEQRTCLYLRFFCGLSVVETAVRMKRSVGAVKSLQLRAIRQLASSVPDDMAMAS